MQHFDRPAIPNIIENESSLEDLLSTPTQKAIDAVSRMQGNLMLLGVGGKMGPTLARMARRAADAVNPSMRIFGVSRFSNPTLRQHLEDHGIETISCDLLDRDALSRLPDVENIIYMAGWKFGSSGNEGQLWAMNTFLPALVAERFRHSRIVVFSTGNVYPFTLNDSGGSRESDRPGPVGEYAQSCLGRERMIEYFSRKYSIPSLIIRLNYAVELRYGVLLDIGAKVYSGTPLSLAMGYVNVIWQGDANVQTLQCFDHCTVPPMILNMTGLETLSVRDVALKFGQRFGKDPLFQGEEESTSLLNNASLAKQLFGPPSVSISQVIDWIAHWITLGGASLEKPTHYEGREGKY